MPALPLHAANANDVTAVIAAAVVNFFKNPSYANVHPQIVTILQSSV